MSNSTFERYTSTSCRDGRPIVPLIQFANKNDGRLPDNGQFVPTEVIERLSFYECSEESGAMIITKAVIGDEVFIPFFDASVHDVVVSNYIIEAIHIAKNKDGMCIQYGAKMQDGLRMICGKKTAGYTFSESDLGSSVFLTREEADAFVNDIRQMAAPILEQIKTVGTIIKDCMNDAENNQPDNLGGGKLP